MNKIYPTDLTDTQWNAIFYLLKTGCQWRMLPKEYPKWELVYYYCQKWRDDGTIEEVHDIWEAKNLLKVASWQELLIS